MIDFGRISRVALPIVAGIGVVSAGPWALRAARHDTPAGGPTPDPGPGRAPTPPPASPAADSAAQLATPGREAVPTEEATVARRTYTNPVFSQNVPDPSIVRADDGTFYAYATEDAGQPFQVLRSRDLTSWERVGPAFVGSGPSWVAKHRWAPDVKRTGDHYTMTYSGRGHDGMMKVGYATSALPSGPFQDRGILLEGDSGGYYIDPYLQQVGDSWVLYYGSTGGTATTDQTGISAVDVDMRADGSMHVRGPGEVILPEAGDRELVEGAWVQEHDGQYYLFYSDGRWDGKGGTDDYAVKVARGPSPTGPFEKHGEPVMAKGQGFSSTGHNAIVTDDAGRDWMLYHAYGVDPDQGRMLMLDPIEWTDGWPVVNRGRGPSSQAMDAPVIAARRGVDQLGSRS